MKDNRICKLLGIEYPIIQGGMAWIADASLAAAVSEAGGLGIITGTAPIEWIRDEIRKAKKLTNKPFGVNIMLMSPHADEVAKLVCDENVQVVTTGAGSPGKYMEMWKEHGVKVIPVVASVALARRMEKLGADAIVAEGTESGGHVGQLTTMALVPQVADSVEIPVLAAGGIGDGRGIVAGFALGAEGVQIGTRFLVAKECTVHQNYKNKVLKAKDIDTEVTGRSTGHPVRVLRNKLAREFNKLEKEGAPVEDIEKLGEGALRKAAKDGDVDYGSVMAGQIAGLVNKEQTCKEIIDKGEEILKMPIKELLFNGPEDKLMATEIAQPAILLASLASLKALEINGINADYTAGLSLGEYGSLIYGGALSFEEGLLLIKERGRIMGSALPKGLGKMAAIMRLNDEKFNELLKRASEYGVCEGANYNCPGQVVIAGENEAIEKAVEIAAELGGRGILLNVSGPFHSSLLKGASEEFYETIKKVNINPLKKVVYSNTKGLPYDENDDIRILLKNHIKSSVYFEKSIRDMIDKKVETFIEVGPGKALRGFVRKIDRSKTLLNVEDLASLKVTIDKLNENN